jgi:hypothetical protein
METTISLRIPLDHPPTRYDRVTRRGLDLFLIELRRKGWADENNNALKNFEITNEGHAENAEYYIEWTATLSGS